MLTLPLPPPLPPPNPTHPPARSTSPPPFNPSQTTQPHPQPHRRSAAPPVPTALTHLAQAESAIVARKAAIADFGALWLRPPGLSKTLQAMREEAAEREEAEAAWVREQGGRDAEAMAQVGAAERGEVEGDDGMVGVEEEEEEERDLDDDVPEAGEATEGDLTEDVTGDVTGTEAEGDVSRAEEGDGVSFNEASMLSGRSDYDAPPDLDDDGGDHLHAMEEAELTGAARDEEALGMGDEGGEVDLDDEVPEAGSYQHTDTELESSDEDESSGMLQDSFAAQSARRRSGPTAPQAASGPLRASGGLRSSGGLGSSTGSVPRRAPRGGGLQERIRAQTSGSLGGNGGDAMVRSPGSLDLSNSLLESSFVGSSPVMQRSAGRGRGGGRRTRMS